MSLFERIKNFFMGKDEPMTDEETAQAMAQLIEEKPEEETPAPEPDDSQPEDGEQDDTQEAQPTDEEVQSDEETPEPEKPVTLAATVKPNRPIVVTLDASSLNQKDEAWVNIINLGEYIHDDYGVIEFTQENFDSWKRNLERGVMGGILNGKPAIATDYGHAMDIDVPLDQQKASGYIKDLKLETDSDGTERVYALIEFTPVAAQGIRNKEWSWFSVSVIGSWTDQKTGEDVGPILRGGALTNRPFIPDLQPIQLSDLRPSKAMLLSRQLAKERADRQAAETKLFNQNLAASVAALEAAGVPQFVIAAARPLLEADKTAAVLTFSLGGKEQTARPGELVQTILLEMAKLGTVPKGEKTQQRTQNLLTLQQAKEQVRQEWETEGRNMASVREADVILAARKRYPHLKEPKHETEE